jgi:cobalt-zinc-cadmium efflux system membrane fusion protein
VIVGRTEVAVAVPRTALHTIDGEDVVFVGIDGGFRATAVVVGREGTHSAEITHGLAAGDRYVREGGFTLKAELGKEAFGDDDD